VPHNNAVNDFKFQVAITAVFTL